MSVPVTALSCVVMLVFKQKLTVMTSQNNVVTCLTHGVIFFCKFVATGTDTGDTIVS